MSFFVKLLALVIVLPCVYCAALYSDFIPEKVNEWMFIAMSSVGFQPNQKSLLILAALLTVLTSCLYKLWNFFCVPIEIIRKIGDAGYIPDGLRPIQDIARKNKKQRRRGDLPPVFPNGWFQILTSWELQKKEVKFVCVLGEHLAVFRGEDGSVNIVDAYCPHLGANLAIGGQVVGNCLQCPFHGWEYRGTDGQCTKIPYTKNIPSFAKVKSWTCLERNNSIMIWYHAEGAEPTWLPEEVDEIVNGSWSYSGKTTHLVNAHCEEIPENGADINHLDHLHSSPILAGNDLRFTFTSKWLQIMRHVWDAGWSVDEENKHIGKLTLKHEIKIFGLNFPFLDFNLEAKQIGPGLVHMYFKSLLGDGMFIHTVTPEEPLLQRVEHRIYCSRYTPTILAKFYMYGESVQFERDVMVWNHKKYISKPLLVKEDSMIGKHRRWYSQFYSENSPTYDKVMSKNAEW